MEITCERATDEVMPQVLAWASALGAINFLADDLHPRDILLAWCDGLIVGMLIARVVPGQSTEIEIPCPGDDEALATLLAAVPRFAPGKIYVSIQPDESLGAIFEPNGFRRLTKIDLLRRPAPSNDSVYSGTLTMLPYADWDVNFFRQMIVETNRESLDIPELEGRFTPEEVELGLMNQNPDRRRWWIAQVDADALGVLIMNQTHISYLGVLPRARSRGLGSEMVRFAISQSPGPLLVIVDQRNDRARRMYQQQLFAYQCSMAVYARFEGE